MPLIVFFFTIISLRSYGHIIENSMSTLQRIPDETEMACLSPLGGGIVYIQPTSNIRLIRGSPSGARLPKTKKKKKKTG